MRRFQPDSELGTDAEPYSICIAVFGIRLNPTETKFFYLSYLFTKIKKVKMLTFFSRKLHFICSHFISTLINLCQIYVIGIKVDGMLIPCCYGANRMCRYQFAFSFIFRLWQINSRSFLNYIVLSFYRAI